MKRTPMYFNYIQFHCVKVKAIFKLYMR